MNTEQTSENIFFVKQGEYILSTYNAVPNVITEQYHNNVYGLQILKFLVKFRG